MWYRLIEIVASLYGYEYHYILYRLTFAQALTLIEMRNERERKAQESVERSSSSSSPGDGWFDPSPYSDPNDLPSITDVRAAFSQMLS